MLSLLGEGMQLAVPPLPRSDVRAARRSLLDRCSAPPSCAAGGASECHSATSALLAACDAFLLGDGAGAGECCAAVAAAEAACAAPALPPLCRALPAGIGATCAAAGGRPRWGESAPPGAQAQALSLVIAGAGAEALAEALAEGGGAPPAALAAIARDVAAAAGLQPEAVRLLSIKDSAGGELLSGAGAVARALQASALPPRLTLAFSLSAASAAHAARIRGALAAALEELPPADAAGASILARALAGLGVGADAGAGGGAAAFGAAQGAEHATRVSLSAPPPPRAPGGLDIAGIQLAAPAAAALAAAAAALLACLAVIALVAMSRRRAAAAEGGKAPAAAAGAP